MKQFAYVKFSSKYFFRFLAGGIILLLSAISGNLYRKNRIYEWENRQLLIQNDSILSENIELKNSLINRSASQKKTSSVQFNEVKKR